MRSSPPPQRCRTSGVALTVANVAESSAVAERSVTSLPCNAVMI